MANKKDYKQVILSKLTKMVLELKTPMIAILCAFIFGAILILLTGKNPIEAYSALFRGAFGTPQAISQTLNKATPLIFTGLAVSIAYQCKSLNIGGEGQLVFGAFGAALAGIFIKGLPIFIHIPIVIVTGFIFGGLWAVIPGLLKIKKDVNTVISTIMMNYVAFSLVSFLINTYFKAGKSDFVSMEAIEETSMLPFLQFGSFRIGAGIILAIVVAIILKIILQKTVLGYEVKAVGSNPSAANTNGISSKKNVLISLIISGGLAGLAGTVDLIGNMMNGKLYDGYNPGYGFDGIPIALLAKGNPLGVIITALLFSVLRTGSVTMQTSVGVSRNIVDAMQGVIILFIAAEYIFTLYKNARANKKKRGASV